MPDDSLRSEQLKINHSDQLQLKSIINHQLQLQSIIPCTQSFLYLTMSVSRRSDSDIGEPEVGTDDDMDCGDEGGGGGREEVRPQLFSSDMS